MFAAALCLALLGHAQATQPIDTGNRVEVCSLALGDSCQTFAAADLDPTRGMARPGQIAFVDSESGRLVTPTAEQLGELANDLAFSEKLLGDAVKPEESTLPNGAVRMRFPGGYLTHLEVQTKETQP